VQQGEEIREEEFGGKAVWEDSAEKREASLKERKAKMILAARQYVSFSPASSFLFCFSFFILFERSFGSFFLCFVSDCYSQSLIPFRLQTIPGPAGEGEGGHKVELERRRNSTSSSVCLYVILKIGYFSMPLSPKSFH